MGTAYLALLSDPVFKRIEDNRKRRYLVICSYNWGPGSVRRKIVKRHDVAGLSVKELYDILRRKTPKETSNYLKKVTERMQIYAKIKS